MDINMTFVTMVTRLRSRTLRSDRRQRSLKTTSLVSWTNFGATAPVPHRLLCACRPQRREPEVGAHGRQTAGVNFSRVVDLLVGLERGDCARPATVDREMRQKCRRPRSA